MKKLFLLLHISMFLCIIETYGQSLQFNGSNTYVSLGNDTTLHLSAFTLEAWIKVEGSGLTTTSGTGGITAVPIISKGRGEAETPANLNMNYFLGIDQNKKLTADFEEGSGPNHPVVSKATIPDSVWTHVAVSYEPVSAVWKLYINGVLDTTKDLGSNIMPASVSIQPAAIASALNSSSKAEGYFKGKIDEVRIWNLARSDSDILNNYKLELTSGTGLIARYGLNDGSGTIATNTFTSASNGTLINNPYWSSDQIFQTAPPPPSSTLAANHSIQFNGVNSYISLGIADGSNNTQNLNLNAFTLEAWIKVEGSGLTTTSGTGGITAIPIVSKGRAEAETPANLNMNYFLGIDKNKKLTADFEESTGPNHPVVSKATIPDSVWTHVAVSYEPVSAVWKLYINGVLDTIKDLGSNIFPVTNSIQYAAIASALNSKGTPDGYFKGKIDEVRIWNSARSDADILNNYKRELSSGIGLVARYEFDEGTGTITADSISLVRNGTLINNPVWSDDLAFQAIPLPPDSTANSNSTTNQSLQFNGSNTYVSLGNDTTLHLSAFTLEAWIKVEGSGLTTTSGTGGITAVPIISKGRGEAETPANLNMNYFLGIDQNKKLTADFEEGSGPNHPVVSKATIPDSVWTHVAVSYEPVSAVWKLYINGVLDTTKDLGSNIMPASVSIQPAAIASALNSSSKAEGYFKGKIDEVRIWNLARSDSDILNNYKLELTSGTGLIARYGLNDGSNSIPNSVVGNPNGIFYGTGPTYVKGYSLPPNSPTNPIPYNSAYVAGDTTTLCVTVSDPSNDKLRVKFYSRKKKPAGKKFSMILLPDTQFYTADPQGGATVKGSYNAMFISQTKWIADNQAVRNIAYVAHLGDCVDHGDSLEIEWKRVDTAMRILEDSALTGLSQGIPYGMSVGNHDLSPVDSTNGTTTLFNQYFGISRFTGRSYYGGSMGTNNNNHYDLFSASGIDFLILYFQYDDVTHFTAAGGALDWADTIIKNYPNRKIIVVTHFAIDYSANFSKLGQAAYNRFKVYPNFILMVGGHVTGGIGGPGEASRSDIYNGNTVYSTLQDYQGRINGGNGLLRIYEFDPQSNNIAIQTYSPYTSTYETDANSQFNLAVKLTSDSSNSYQLIGEVSNITSGSNACLKWPVNQDADYEWYVEVYNSDNKIVGSVWSFTTKTLLTLQTSHSGTILSSREK